MSFNIVGNIVGPSAANIQAFQNRIRSAIGNGISAPITLRFARGQQQNLNNLVTGVNNLSNALQRYVPLANRAATATSSLASAMQQYRGVGRQATRTAGQIASNINNAANSALVGANAFESFGIQIGKSIKSFAAFATISTVVFGFTGAVSDGISQGIEFERQLLRVAQVSQTSISSLGQLTGTIDRLSTSLGVSSKDLVGIAATLKQAGLNANETEKALQALGKASLAPTFTSIENTTEALIAARSQFNLAAEDFDDALGSINAVASRFAVEADDISTAIRRFGGVFVAAKGDIESPKQALNELIAIFTSVRSTTRESAESIATGLRTITTRIQRGSTIRFLESIGAKLRDADGNFVGLFRAFEQLSIILNNVPENSALFARIAEEIGGFRQISRTIPGIKQFGVAQEAFRVAQEGTDSTTRDAAKAQETLAIQLQKTREEFLKLIRDVLNDQGVKFFTTSILEMTRAFIGLASTLRPLIPLLAVVGTFKLAAGLGSIVGGIGRGLGLGGLAQAGAIAPLAGAVPAGLPVAQRITLGSRLAANAGSIGGGLALLGGGFAGQGVTTLTGNASLGAGVRGGLQAGGVASLLGASPLAAAGIGILSGLSSFQEQNRTDDAAKATEKLTNAFEKLSKLTENLANGDFLQAATAVGLGSSAIQNSLAQQLRARGLNAQGQLDSRFSSFGRGSSAVNLGLAGAGIGSFFSPIGTAIGGAIGVGLGALSTEGTRRELSRGNVSGAIFGDLFGSVTAANKKEVEEIKQTLRPQAIQVSNEIFKALSDQVNKAGSDFKLDDFIKSIGGLRGQRGQALALTNNNFLRRAVRARAQGRQVTGTEQTARAVLEKRLNLIRKQANKQLQEQIKQWEKNLKAVDDFQRGLENFADKVSNVANEASRAGRTISGLLNNVTSGLRFGGGLQTRADVNNRFGGGAGGAATLFANIGAPLAGVQVQRRFDAGQELRRALPDLIRGAIGRQNPEDVIGRQVEQRFGAALGPGLTRQLRDSIDNAFRGRSGQEAGALAALPQAEQERLLIKPLLEANKAVAEALNKGFVPVINRFVAQLEQIVGLQVGINADRANLFGAAGEFGLSNTQAFFGRDPTRAQRELVTNAQLESLGINTRDPAAITRRATGIQRDLFGLQRSLATGRDADNVPIDPEQVGREIANLTTELGNLQNGLQILARSNNELAGAQKELADLQRQRLNSRSFLERLGTADQRGQIAIAQEAAALRGLQGGLNFVNLSREEREAAFRAVGNNGIGALTLPPQELEKLRARLFGQFANLFDGAFGRRVGIAGQIRGNDPREVGLQNRIEGLQGRQIRARQGLIDLRQLRLDEASRGVFTEFNKRIEQFREFAKELVNAAGNMQQAAADLKGIPEKIQVEGALAVNVNINGAEILQDLNPSISKMIEQRVKRELERRTGRPGDIGTSTA